MMLIITFLALAIAFEPATIKIGVQDVPTVYYNTNKEEWTVPLYNQLKDGIICLERNDIKCLKGSK